MSHTKQRLTNEQRDLVERNLEIAKSVGGYAKTRLERDDAIQEAALGMMLAAKNYDPGRGATYKTFARRIAAYSIADASAECTLIPMPYEARKADIESGEKRFVNCRLEAMVDEHSEFEPIDNASRKEWHNRFHWALSRLSERRQSVVKLALKGMPSKAVARELGITRNCAEVTLRLSLTQIAAIMTSPGEVNEILTLRKKRASKIGGDAHPKYRQHVYGARRLSKLRKKADTMLASQHP